LPLLIVSRRSCYSLCPYTTLFRSRIFKGSNHHLWQVWIKSRIGAKGLHDVLTWAAIPSGEGSAEKLKQYYQARGLIVETLDSERSEEHTSELQSRFDLVCRLLLAK